MGCPQIVENTPNPWYFPTTCFNPQANQKLFYTKVRVSWSPLNYICLVKFVFPPPSSRFSHQSPTPTHFNCQDPCTTIADISKYLFLLVHWDGPRRHTIPQPADMLTQTALITNAQFFWFVCLSSLTYYYLFVINSCLS